MTPPAFGLRAEGSEDRLPVILAFGGGINSMALTAEWLRREEPLDLLLFSDTGGEKPETYLAVDRFDAWLASRGYPETRRVALAKKDGSRLMLEADVRARHTLPALAFGWKTCAARFKREPQERFVNRWPPAIDAWGRGRRVVKLVGFHAGEAQRVAAAPITDGKYIYRYPLAEWGWDNRRCADELRRAGLPIPPKSACFFCPASKRAEIVELGRRHPELYARALAMEDDARAHGVQMPGLGRRFSWRDVAPLRERAEQLVLPCECVDGSHEDDDDVEAAS